MKIVQISVFLENKKGRLYEVCSILGKNNINIRALNIAESPDYGILRLVVDKPEEAVNVLKKNSLTATMTDIIAVEVPDIPGGLAGVLKIINDTGLNIEYMYAFFEKKTDKALIVFRFEDIDKAIKILKEKGLSMAKKESIL